MQEFELYRKGILHSRLSSAIFLMAVPLYLSFSLIDKLFAPDLWLLFLGIRCATCILFLGLASWMRRPMTADRVVAIAHLVTLSLGCGIGYMTFRTGGFNSPYHAGLNWIAIGSLAFWPSGPRDRIITILTIYSPLLLLESIFGFNTFNVVSLLSLTFMTGTVILSLISNILSLKSLQEEFRLRFELERLVRHKEEIIAVKSNEAANLKRLAKQFSPAVIQAIETKEISVGDRNRKKVAILFIDVAGSTARSTSLDHSDYQLALDMFFDLAIKTLLARNITVANFMGDGLMAIANAPYPLADYEKVAFEAAVEIIEETAQRQRTLREHWREDFHVRIGISSGYANVGFFPNSDFGVYTAIGESVNLASRLCTAAKSSTLATTKNVLLSSGEAIERCTVQEGGSISTFKGFAGHNLEYFIATPKIQNAITGISQSCPLCDHELRQSADLGDCVVLKCTRCQYTDIQTIVSASSIQQLKRAA